MPRDKLEPADLETGDWTERYRPVNLDDVVGNKEARNQLKRWAEQWISGKPKKRAVILAGKPGIGKTSSAIALANYMGWGYLEMNASDERNSEAIKKRVGRSAVDDTFSEDGEFIPYRSGKRTLLIIDEADNIFGREDRGGVREIRKTIDRTEQPMVLIANDYYDLRRRSKSLSQRLKKIEYKPVNKNEIIKHLQRICKSEGISYESSVLNSIAERSDGDVRSAVRDLQSVGTGREKIKKEHLDVLGYRNREADIFPTLRAILQGQDPLVARDSIRELNEEPRNLLTWIDENLPREYSDPVELASAYEWLTKADIFLGRVVSSQYYRLWSYANDMMTAGVNCAKIHQHRGWTKYAFPTWIRKMTSSKGKRSKRKKISMKIAEEIHTTTDRVRSDVMPYFKELFARDDEFMMKMIEDLELKPSEAAFILDKDVDSKYVQSLYKEEEKDTVKIKKKTKIEDKDKKEGEKKKEERSPQKSLLEF